MDGRRDEPGPPDRRQVGASPRACAEPDGIFVLAEPPARQQDFSGSAHLARPPLESKALAVAAGQAPPLTRSSCRGGARAAARTVHREAHRDASCLGVAAAQVKRPREAPPWGGRRAADAAAPDPLPQRRSPDGRPPAGARQRASPWGPSGGRSDQGRGRTASPCATGIGQPRAAAAPTVMTCAAGGPAPQSTMSTRRPPVWAGRWAFRWASASAWARWSGSASAAGSVSSSWWARAPA